MSPAQRSAADSDRVSEEVAALTNKLAGGHRQATHSLWFAGGIAVLVWWLGRFALAAPILVYACLALTLTMLVPAGIARRGSTLALVGPVAAGWAVWRAQTGSWLTDPTRVADPHTWAWLPVAAGIGVGLHLVGDMLTVKGVPLLWPARLRLAAPCSAIPTGQRATGRGLSLVSAGRPGLGRNPPSPTEKLILPFCHDGRIRHGQMRTTPGL